MSTTATGLPRHRILMTGRTGCNRLKRRSYIQRKNDVQTEPTNYPIETNHRWSSKICDVRHRSHFCNIRFFGKANPNVVLGSSVTDSFQIPGIVRVTTASETIWLAMQVRIQYSASRMFLG
ncbi:hypothetical protein BGX38DRAFT_1156016 [Terfezia claveryi]|nr:hypothetical protein BGX38DRAFT_1156016 [Terfezia claveryi]